MNEKAVLLTGATGFVGSHVARTILNAGYKVVCLKRSSSDPWRLADQSGIIWCDIGDDPDLGAIFTTHRFEAVIHAATAYGKKGEDNASLLLANVHFPLRLLELAIKHQVALFITTDTFFKTSVHKYSYMQNYTLSKSHFSDWMKLAGNAIRMVSLSLYQVYGEADSDTKFITRLLLNLGANTPSMDFTGGEQKRDFIYVADVANAYLSVLRGCAQVEPGLHLFDVGTAIETRLRTFVELAANLSGSNTHLNFGAIPYLPDEIFSSQANIEPMAKKFGWKPDFSLSDGLARTVAWFTRNRQRYS